MSALILLSILSYDVWFYISHLLLHSKLLYKYHSIHHSKDNPRFMDTYLGHPLEGPFQGIGMFAPYIFYNYSMTETAIILAFLNVRGMMRHDDRCSWLIGNHHLMHHKCPNYNYGEYWIDWLCSTVKK
jgi:sterol desaturase/sphingolipid hydroxylase (fatty acid hydroxylase superfamily)